MYFVVLYVAGPVWDHSLQMREQKAWDEHAEFMDSLTAEGVVVLGGPLAGGDTHRAMVVCAAVDETTLRGRLALDPWIVDGVLDVASLDEWDILLDSRAPRDLGVHSPDFRDSRHPDCG